MFRSQWAEACTAGSVPARPAVYLLHLELSPWPSGDNRFGPLVDRLALLTPILLGRVPGAALFQRNWDQVQCGCIDPRGFNDAGQVGSPSIVPSLARPDRGDLAGNNIPEATGAKRDGVVAPQQTAARRLLLHREDSEIDWTA